MNFLSFQPLHQERVWGGRALADWLGRTLPGSAPIGERWPESSRPAGPTNQAEVAVANRPGRPRPARTESVARAASSPAGRARARAGLPRALPSAASATLPDADRPARRHRKIRRRRRRAGEKGGVSGQAHGSSQALDRNRSGRRPAAAAPRPGAGRAAPPGFATGRRRGRRRRSARASRPRPSKFDKDMPRKHCRETLPDQTGANGARAEIKPARPDDRRAVPAPCPCGRQAPDRG